MISGIPGSAGEHVLQQECGTGARAVRFYADQMADRITPAMESFIARMEMAWVATADAAGECDCSFRAGPAGFVRVLSDRQITYPEYRGNGVMASLGNILQNPHVGLFFADFAHDLVGLHVNGQARIVTPTEMRYLDPGLAMPDAPGRVAGHWVLVSVDEAYIHCSKHIPKLVPQSRVRHWGSDNPRHKGGDHFGVAALKSASL
jgi:predicted pyridoxine 5'-phosphate oxidase superfamily flavin-nucleotide-binding protein